MSDQESPSSFELVGHGEFTLAEVTCGHGSLATVQDATDLVGNASYSGATHMLLPAECLDASFFDLRSGFAGEVMQKFVNYHLRLAIIGDFERYGSASLQAFIREANAGRHFAFVADRSEALAVITSRLN